MKRWLLIGLLLPALASADFNSDTQEALGYGLSGNIQATLEGLKSGQDPNAALYGGQSSLGIGTTPCGQPDAQGKATCGGQSLTPTANPTEAGYYSALPSTLEDQARQKVLTDEQAGFLYNTAVAQPSGLVTHDDPMFKYEEQNIAAMNTLTSTYSGCQTVKSAGGSGQVNRQCFKTGRPNTVHCQRTWLPSCNWLNLNPIKPSSGQDIETPSTTRYIPQANGTVAQASSSTPYVHHTMPASTSFLMDVNMKALVPESFFYLQYEMWVSNSDNKWDWTPHLVINGVEVPRTTSFSPLGSKYWRFYTSFTGLINYLHDGLNRIEISSYVSGITSEVMFNLVDPRVCEHVVDESFACDAGKSITGLQQLSTTCHDSAPRYVSGNRFDRSCWVQDEQYGHAGNAVFQEEATCGQLRSQGCYVTREDCLTRDPSGFCAKAQMTFNCDTDTQEQTVQVCGDTLVCPDGKCTESVQEKGDGTQDFMKTASYLQLMKDMKNHFDPNNLSVFKGTYQECSVDKTLVGTNQCCTGGTGFLNTIGAKCSAEENMIVQARNAAVVTALPEYETCGAHVLGTCVKWVEHMPYCIWPSKLARMLQEQGRAQLGQTIDSRCAGFKLSGPNEIEMLDMGKMDFSEYFADVQARLSATPLPQPDTLVQKMQSEIPNMAQKLSDRYKDLGK